MHSLDSKPWHSFCPDVLRDFESEGVSVIRVAQRTNWSELEPEREGRIRNHESGKSPATWGLGLFPRTLVPSRFPIIELH